MRLLLFAFEMDDESAVLAWQASVVRALAERCESVVVLTGRVGKVRLPPNVIVQSLPRRPFGVPYRLGGTWLVNWHVLRLCRRQRIQACFVHMAMEWAIYLSPAMRLLRIPVLLWYAHGTTSNRLRLAHALVDQVVTSSPEGFRLPSSKLRVIGQGVDAELFTLVQPNSSQNEILHVGRISRRKRIERLLSVMASLVELEGPSPIRLRLVGPPLTAADLEYDREMRSLARELGLQDRVEFVGYVPQEQIPFFYRSAFLHLNLSQTGSMDKTVLEALACGCPVLTSNEAFFELLKGRPEFIVGDDRPEAIGQRVLEIYHTRDDVRRMELREMVVGRHDLSTYADNVMECLRKLVR